ncbi:response regulator transcription factor [Stenotrophomonas sp.]
MRILLAEDDAALAQRLVPLLEQAGYVVHVVADGRQAEEIGQIEDLQAAIVDLGLPGLDGLSVIERWRGNGRSFPVLVLTARGRWHDKLAGFDAGADDYLTKPFGFGELLARLRVALRHAQKGPATADPTLEIGPIKIDRARREVFVAGVDLHLTPTEYRLLVLLAENAGRVLTHRHILSHVWGPTHTGHSHYVRVQVAELRKKIEVDAARPKWLVTEPGVGYRLRDREPGA